jgi:Flp pilus assembly protein TadG
MVLLFLGALDLGLVIRDHQVLQNAAREGARFSTLPANWVSPVNPNATVADIEQRVIDYLQQEGIAVGPGDITVNQTYPINVGVVTAWGSEVVVTYTRSFLIPGAPLLPFGQVTLGGRSVFRNLY